MKSSPFWVPNTVTTANIFCGFFSILSTIHGDYRMAAWLICAAGIFDLFDGRLARLLGATSAFGENYDTLSDLTSFGVAPALLLAQMCAPLGPMAAGAVSFAYLISVAYRLARFSVQTAAAKSVNPSAGKANFSGLSSPPSALTLSAFVILIQAGNLPASIPMPLALAVLALVLAALMASKIPFPSFKSVNWRSRQGNLLLAIIAVGLFLIFWNPQVFLFLVGIFFVVANLTWNVAQRFTRE